jgi:hypothetical protein
MTMNFKEIMKGRRTTNMQSVPSGMPVLLDLDLEESSDEERSRRSISLLAAAGRDSEGSMCDDEQQPPGWGPLPTSFVVEDGGSLALSTLTVLGRVELQAGSVSLHLSGVTLSARLSLLASTSVVVAEQVVFSAPIEAVAATLITITGSDLTGGVVTFGCHAAKSPSQ